MTIRLDGVTLKRARAEAAGRGLTLSGYIDTVLRNQRRTRAEYDAAYQAWRSGKPLPVSGPVRRRTS